MMHVFHGHTRRSIAFVVGTFAIGTIVSFWYHGSVHQFIGTSMQLTSPVFRDHTPLPARYTCDGERISPPLTIADVPADAKTLALILDDPDAVGGKTFIHWVVWNINPSTTTIAEDTVPPGARVGTSDYGTIGYGPPCPPSGTHRYIFHLYALDAPLNLLDTTTAQELRAAMDAHMLSETTLTGLYTRAR